MQTCPVTGRIHRTQAELYEELIHTDRVLSPLHQALEELDFRYGRRSPVPARVYDAWNRLHDAVDELERYRADVEANPRPLLESDRAEYELVIANID